MRNYDIVMTDHPAWTPGAGPWLVRAMVSPDGGHALVRTDGTRAEWYCSRAASRDVQVLQAARRSFDLGGASLSRSCPVGRSSTELEDGALARAEFPNIAGHSGADHAVRALGLNLYGQVAAAQRNQDRSLPELHRE
jgi:hypothetical protein